MKDCIKRLQNVLSQFDTVSGENRYQGNLSVNSCTKNMSCNWKGSILVYFVLFS